MCMYMCCLPWHPVGVQKTTLGVSLRLSYLDQGLKWFSCLLLPISLGVLVLHMGATASIYVWLIVGSGI